MMALFVVIVAVLLAASDLAFYFLVSESVREQFDHALLVAAAPIARDLAAEVNSQDVGEFDAPDEYFVLLDLQGHVLQRSRNLQGSMLELGTPPANLTQPYFRLATSLSGQIRVAFIPIHARGQSMILGVAMPTRDSERMLLNFRTMGAVLWCLSLLLSAGLSAFYVGRSLAPVNELTKNAAETSDRIGRATARALWTPLAVRHPADELGRLAETFNHLFVRVDNALRQLRQFVSDASHELRTPLSVLQGETELVLSVPRNVEEYQRTLRVIDGELKKLTRIVEGLFTLAMADAGELRLIRGPLYLNEVLEDACRLVDSLAQAKSITIQRELSLEVSLVGDEAFLHQLFLIFLDNAIKYSPPQTRITVTLTQEQDVVKVRFEDQGFGIAPEHLQHVFERFYRVLQPGVDETDSGGLGLAIAQAIARAHRGTVDCQSQEGNGSIFTVTLPTGTRTELRADRKVRPALSDLDT
jgi:two-component system, OmpR family, sensor kinase